MTRRYCIGHGVIDPNLLLSAYEGDGQNVVVVINLGTQERTIGLESEARNIGLTRPLKRRIWPAGVMPTKGIRIPARSVITLVPDRPVVRMTGKTGTETFDMQKTMDRD